MSNPEEETSGRLPRAGTVPPVASVDAALRSSQGCVTALAVVAALPLAFAAWIAIMVVGSVGHGNTPGYAWEVTTMNGSPVPAPDGFIADGWELVAFVALPCLASLALAVAANRPPLHSVVSGILSLLFAAIAVAGGLYVLAAPVPDPRCTACVHPEQLPSTAPWNLYESGTTGSTESCERVGGNPLVGVNGYTIGVERVTCPDDYLQRSSDRARSIHGLAVALIVLGVASGTAATWLLVRPGLNRRSGSPEARASPARGP